ncbi:hypothetical protein M408DRAFT_37829, partial [Serendipita vermifera MAFF 305830]
IVMTCLNLPPQERHREENLYVVAVLPGRHQQADINPSLEPLIDELLCYWHEGTYFVGVPGITGPRLIRCALVQLVCDLPAARKVAGFMGHSATYMCSVCKASLHALEDIDSYNIPEMQRKSSTHIQRAREYLDTLQEDGIESAERSLHPRTDSESVRWSVLNKLPYWDPVKCTVLDAMHMVLLGNCRFHWQ